MNDRFDKIAPGLPNKLHFFVDVALAELSLWVAMSLHDAVVWQRFIALALVVALCWTVMSVLTRLYSPHTPRRLSDSLTLRLLVVASTAFVLAAFASFYYSAVDFDSAAFVALCFCGGALAQILIFRPLANLVPHPDDVLIVGTGTLAQATYDYLRRLPPDRQRRVRGFVTLETSASASQVCGLPILGCANDFLQVLSNNPVSEVYFSARVVEHGERMQHLVDVCERVGMPFAVPVHSLRFQRARLMSNSPATDGYLHYMSTAHKPVQYAFKRLIDIVASAFALVVLSPLMAAVAVAIKSTSKGPVFFVQKRVGLQGYVFGLFKFRSMVSDAEALKAGLMARNEQSGPVFKIKRDPRVTLVGRVIRKFSIDELPQLINILRGDMTIVGPRPALPQEVAQYLPWQRRRLSVRPGLTCYWQVTGRNEIAFDEWMRLDLRYVDHWNLGVDLQLIMQTFPVVLAGRGAS